MGDVSKSGDGTKHGNTIIVQKVRIFFQVYPGVAGTDAQRGIAGVPYSVEIGPKDGIALIFEGKTATDGGVELSIPKDEMATLTIFDTEYLIASKRSIMGVDMVFGVQQRLGGLGYYLGEIKAAAPDEKMATALLNFQADSNLNADGKFTADSLGNTSINEVTGKQLKKDFGA